MILFGFVLTTVKPKVLSSPKFSVKGTGEGIKEDFSLVVFRTLIAVIIIIIVHLCSDYCVALGTLK